MSSNRKFKNGMWKDASKQQEKISGELFLEFQESLGKDFLSMGMNFDQLTGECLYTFYTIHYEYSMLLNRAGIIIQENMTKPNRRFIK